VEFFVTESIVPSGRQPLTLTVWLILFVAVIGFAFDTYTLLVMPLIARPALSELLGVDPNTASGNAAVLRWTGYIMYGSALCGGTFGMLGGYLTDLFGRRRVLTYSILLYAFAALASGFSTTAFELLIWRCIAFIGVCVEFVAAVAWLAELFPNPWQRESVLGYTQAFSSIGGLLITGSYKFINLHAQSFPAIFDGHAPWRYALISGIIPAFPLIIIRPFLPESPGWQAKRAAGTLRRPSFVELFHPALRRTTLITAALFACSFGAAFGAIQLTPQIVPGLVDDLKPLPGLRESYEAAKDEKKLKALEERAAEEAKAAEENSALKDRAERTQKQLAAAKSASTDQVKLDKLKERVEELQRLQEDNVSNVQIYQEIGGLIGRFVLAWLALRILSRRRLLRVFQIPGLVLIPLVFLFPAAGNLPQYNIELLKAGIFVAGFLTVAQFSYWGNYLPLVYPTYLRGTGESFAANVGGRMVGTAANPLATWIAVGLLAAMPALPRSTGIAYSAAAVAFLVYAVGSILTFFLPEPKVDGSLE
jgi:MFS family permease